MRQNSTLIILLLWTALSFGQMQLIARNAEETAAQFAERQKPKNATLTHNVIEALWNGNSTIISLYDLPYKLSLENDPDQQTYHKIIGFVFSELDKNTYSKVTFGPIDTEGGSPSIETVFFANADNDKAKELLLIASWEQRHFEVNGTLYGTYVFDNETIEKSFDLKLLEEISKKLDGGCECTWSDGTSKKSRFKTAAAVKKELVKLGY